MNKMDKQEYQEILKKGEKYLKKNDFDGFFNDDNIFPIDSISGWQSYPDFVQVLLNNDYTEFLRYMTYIPDDLFYECSYKGILKIPSNIKEIKIEGLASSNIENIILSEGLKKIRENVFYESSIKKIKIPESCTEIGLDCFGCCYDLTDIYLPKSLVNLQEDFIFSEDTDDLKIHSPNNIEDFDFFGDDEFKENFERCLVK